MPTLEPRFPTLEPRTALIAGIKTYVYGLENVDPHKPVVLAMGLHPRTLDYKYIEILAGDLVANVANVVVATFDLPNHGTRKLDERFNEDWAGGNPTHAQDISSAIELAAAEAETIARHIPSYFAQLERAASAGSLTRVAFGASLGGHICWQIAAGPQGPMGSGLFSGICPLVGCPALGDMLQNRYSTTSNGHEFPLSTMLHLEDLSARVRQLARFPEFRILALCGGYDKLVPASYSVEWASNNANPLQRVVVDENVGHFASDKIRDDMIEWFRGVAAAGTQS